MVIDHHETNRTGRVPRVAERIACPQCGYDLRAIESGRCPECGFGYDHQAVRDVALADSVELDRKLRTSITLSVIAIALAVGPVVLDALPWIARRRNRWLIAPAAVLMLWGVRYLFRRTSGPAFFDAMTSRNGLLAIASIIAVISVVPEAAGTIAVAAVIFAGAAWWRAVPQHDHSTAAIEDDERSTVAMHSWAAIALLATAIGTTVWRCIG